MCVSVCVCVCLCDCREKAGGIVNTKKRGREKGEVSVRGVREGEVVRWEACFHLFVQRRADGRVH